MPEEKIRKALFRTPASAERCRSNHQVALFTCSLSRGELVPSMGWASGHVQGLGQGGGWGGFPTPLVVVHVGGVHGTLLFLSVLQKWKFFFSHNLSQMSKHIVLFHPLYFCCISFSRRCLSRCNHCSPCSQGCQVPTCISKRSSWIFKVYRTLSVKI